MYMYIYKEDRRENWSKKILTFGLFLLRSSLSHERQEAFDFSSEHPHCFTRMIRLRHRNSQLVVKSQLLSEIQFAKFASRLMLVQL